MEKSSKQDLNRNFITIILLYMAFFNCNMIISVNIGNLLIYLPETTAAGIALLVAFQLLVQIVSVLFFGSYVSNITEKYSRKKIFLISNSMICIGFFMVAMSINFTMFFIFSLIANIGNGAFLPIGFAIIGDSFPPKERGNKFGLMNFALLMGSGGGIIFGGLIGMIGPIGWRIAYCFAAFLVFGAIILYYRYGIDVRKGQADPEFKDLEADNQKYDYKITFSNFSQILKKKSVIGIYIVVILTAITATTMGTWSIYFISMKIDSPYAIFIASTLIILIGLGGLFGAIFGGKMGDSLSQKGKVRGRAVISLFATLLATISNMIFYLFLPFNINIIIFSFMLFFIVGFISRVLRAIPGGNIYAIYSEVCVPENRGLANSMNGLMAKTGGIIGNLIISVLIISSISNLRLAVVILLSISLIGSFLWLLPLFYYPKEAQKLRDLMAERRKELELRK